MNLGNGIKPDKGARWAQAIAPNLLPGETIHLLLKGSAGGMNEDLVAITDLRVLSTQTVHHCRIKTQTLLEDITAVELASGMRGNAVQMTMRNGEKRRIIPTQMMGKTDLNLALQTVQGLLVNGVPEHLRAAHAAERHQAHATQTRREQAENGLWPHSIVVGSRPRKKAAASILAHAKPGEEPWLIIGSLGAGVLAAFEDRLILIKTGALTSAMAGSFGGERATTFNFHDITGIEYNSGILNGVLEILTPSYNGTANRDFWRGTLQSRNADSNDPYTLSNTLPLTKAEHAEAQPHLNELRRRVNDFKRTVTLAMLLPAQVTAPAPAGGLAEEIAKIAALRDSGILTEGEFQAAKTRLLSQ